MSGYATVRGPGVGAALRFLSAARNDEGLGERVAALHPEDGLEPVVKLAAEAGFEFTRQDLRSAYVHDWAFRRARSRKGDARYEAAEPQAESAASTVAVVNSPSSST